MRVVLLIIEWNRIAWVGLLYCGWCFYSGGPESDSAKT